MATLLMNQQEGTIVQLYSRGTHGIFGTYQLSVFAVVRAQHGTARHGTVQQHGRPAVQSAALPPLPALL
eukprot:SAG22_NODE_1138_length_5389_cov_22.995085_6_plen_69_part_00